MKIVIIGTGNVATAFGKLLLKAGHGIIQVFGRNEARAVELARALGAAPCSSWNHMDRSADLYLLAIADKAVYEMDQHLELSAGQLIVHTAGSVPKEVLQKISARYGVLYPLQSLRKELEVITEIPLLADANTEEALTEILVLARQMSSNVTMANDEQRLKLHLAATIVNNFTNHLYAESEKFCLKENIPFQLLFPLVAETARRLEVVSPGRVLTGPAIRRDQVTIDKHLALLENQPSLKKLYLLFTESIQAYG
jgi:predicted short-subunit dehydrogenase-like oxidoreductase (DUF2520 family)